MLCCCLGPLKRKAIFVAKYFRKTSRCLCTKLLIWERFACNDYAENIKQKNFQARVEQEGFVYLPFILETFGGFSDDVSVFIHRLSSNVATRLNDSKASTQKNMCEMISCVLMKSLARSVSSRFKEFCQSF